MDIEFLLSTQYLWDLEASPLKGNRNSVFPLTEQQEKSSMGEMELLWTFSLWVLILQSENSINDLLPVCY